MFEEKNKRGKRKMESENKSKAKRKRNPLVTDNNIYRARET